MNPYGEVTVWRLNADNEPEIVPDPHPDWTPQQWRESLQVAAKRLKTKETPPTDLFSEEP